MITSRITSKSQTTIPRAVRAALGVKPGDEIGYEIEGNIVTLKRSGRSDFDPFLENFSTFWEWDTDADRKGYADL